MSSAAVNRFGIKGGNAAGGIHVRISSWDPEVVQIQVFEPPGIPISERTQKNIEKFYGRQDFRRAFYTEMGRIHFPDRAHDAYMRGLTKSWDTELIRARGYRLVIDYSYSPVALVLPLVLLMISLPLRSGPKSSTRKPSSFSSPCRNSRVGTTDSSEYASTASS